MIVESARKLATLLGVSHTRINDLVRQGRITRSAKGFDVDAVRAQLAKSVAPERASRIKADIGQTPHRLRTEPESDQDKYNKARAYRESVRAKADEIALKERMGELIPQDKVCGFISGMIAAAKNRLMTIPDELCDRLATETDPAICRQMLIKKLRDALERLSEWNP